jgi:hypothetical protein
MMAGNTFSVFHEMENATLHGNPMLNYFSNSIRFSQSSLTNLLYVIARQVLPKQSPLNLVKIDKLEIASSQKVLLARTFSDFGRAMSNSKHHH